MAYQAQKTKHSGAKQGKGAYWGYKRDAKKESNRKRRENDKESTIMGEFGNDRISQNGCINMKSDLGEIIFYQSEDGQASVDVHLMNETVWLTQAQMVDLFQRDKRTVSEHIRNIFKEGELAENAVVRKSRTTASDGKKYQTNFYNLDVIISAGYRIKSQRGTQFRIWATTVLKDHLVQGYSINQRRLAEKGSDEIRQVLSLLSKTLEGHELVNDEGRAVLDIVNQYARTWHLLLQYDEDNLSLPKPVHNVKGVLELAEVRSAVASLKQELMAN